MADKSSEFIEVMGRHMEEEGIPRIAGRLMGALLVNQAPASLDDLTEQLRVSKGSISSNARLLERWGIADRVTLPGDRRDYYRISPDVEERVLLRQLERTRLMLQRLEIGREAVAEQEGPARERFDALIDLLTGAVGQTERKLRQKRKE